MKQLFIPPLDTKLTLAADWTLKLYHDGRNQVLMRALHQKYLPDSPNEYTEITLPAGTPVILRGYRIRKSGGSGVPGADRVSFTACLTNGHNHRFWVKIEDANKLQVEP